jgi:Spy/CpxP family protein refolding chaperone
MLSKWRILVVVCVFCLGLSSWAVAQEFAQETAQGLPQGSARQKGAPPSGGPPQGFGFKWWQDEKFKTELGLTTDQCRRAEEVYQGVRPRLTSDMEELGRLEKRLSDVIAAGILPEADVVKMIDQVETARAQLGKVRTLMTYRLRQMLTPDQRAKIKAMHDAWEKERRQGPVVRKRLERMPPEGGLL